MFLVIQDGEYQEIQEELSLKVMQHWVGIPGESAYIEIAREQFSDPYIDLVFDEEFLFKGFAPTCLTTDGVILCGAVLAVAHDGKGNTIGLTQKQIEIVESELQVISEVMGNLIIFRAKEE